MKVLKRYQTLIPLVLGALREDEEETIMKVLENFNELVDVKNVLKPHLFTISTAALQIASNAQFSQRLREAALYFLEKMPELHHKTLKKNKEALAQIVQACFRIASASFEEQNIDEPESPEDEEQTPQTLALYVLYNFAVCLPKSTVFPLLMQECGAMLSAPQQFARKAAVKLLGFIADPDACTELIKDNVEEITGKLVQLLQDPSFKVREEAAVTVGKFSEHIVPDFLQQHATVLPALLGVLQEL